MRPHPRHTVRTIAVIALPAILLLGVTLYLAQGENEPPRILRPPDKSVLPPGPVEIAVIVPGGSEPLPITLDGKKLRVTRPSLSTKQTDGSQRLVGGVFLAPAIVAVPSLQPGRHELRAGDVRVRFFVLDKEGKKSPPDGWLPYVAHPPADGKVITCTGCHTLGKQGRFANMNAAFSMEKPTGCFDCHEQSEFGLTHNHRYESIAYCQMCHDPHGAADENLLKIPKEKACTLCHE